MELRSRSSFPIRSDGTANRREVQGRVWRFGGFGYARFQGQFQIGETAVGPHFPTQIASPLGSSGQ